MSAVLLTSMLLGASPQVVRDGFDERVLTAFEANHGKPLVRAKKRPPLKAGRGNYTRHYSYSIVQFATRCFVLDEQIDAANSALTENAQHYLDNAKDLADRDSFHWHAEMLCRLIEHYGSRGSVAPGRMTKATEDVNMRVLLRHASLHKPIRHAGLNGNTWNIVESENHHLQGIVAAWHAARLGVRLPMYTSFTYADGTTPTENLAAWNEYLKRYLLERARKGLFVEVASDSYNFIGLKGLYNVFDFATDTELKRRAGMLLEMYWALWAQEQINGVRGGGKCRIYQNGNDRNAARSTHGSEMAWFYFGIDGAPKRARCPLLAALTSTWRPSLLVTELAIDVEGRGRYAVRQRPLGLAADGAFNPPDYRVRSDFGAMHRYTWCTPSYIMGTIMLEPLPWDAWTMISSQNRWHGVIFAGHPLARIVPQVRADDHRANFNQQWSVQSRGAMICQKLHTSHHAQEMRLWFPTEGLTDVAEQRGWIFAAAPEAYAAVRVLRGGSVWQKSEDHKFGKWLTCKDPFTPVIIQVAEKVEYADVGAFRDAVCARPLGIENGVAKYHSFAGDELTLPIRQGSMPTVNGKPIDLAYPWAFKSPFVNSRWNSGVITLTKGDRTTVLDLNAP